MSVTPLTLEDARRMIGETFVYHMPFNRELGLKLVRFEQDYAEITFDNDDKLVGNIAQRSCTVGSLPPYWMLPRVWFVLAIA